MSIAQRAVRRMDEGREQEPLAMVGLHFSLTPTTRSTTEMFATRLLRSACTSAGTLAPNATRPPVLWTHLPQELPYALGLLLQESLVAARLNAKKALLAQPDVSSTEASRLNRIANTDILLLLEHKPVFTAGRREKDPATAEAEAKRLGAIGADYVSTMRGGQTTYHGPGQLVGYSLMDLGAAEVRCGCEGTCLSCLVLTLG